MRWLWFSIGATFVSLGAIGVFLPVMPTVPFLLVAAWAFSRSSPELMHKILDHPTYGPPVRAWQERRVIARPAKIWSVGAMSFGVGLTYWLGIDPRIVAVQAAVCLAVGIFIVTRPEV